MTVGSDFREAMRRVASTVAIITAERDGVRYGMTATAIASLSMDPPSLVMCVNRSASLHAVLLERRIACVNVLAEDQAALCSVFSRGTVEERFTHGIWDGRNGAPRLLDAQASIDVQILANMPIGSHEIFVGSVLAVAYRPEATPLVYLQGCVAAVRPMLVAADTA